MALNLKLFVPIVIMLFACIVVGRLVLKISPEGTMVLAAVIAVCCGRMYHDMRKNMKSLKEGKSWNL
jgi:hypothetical protein